MAAAILIDVSGSMERRRRRIRHAEDRSARRAALDLVEQFARYATTTRANRCCSASSSSASERRAGRREVVPMGPPDRARAPGDRAMRADGGTPIGDAMIAGKLALDATGLSRRHLLVVTDGENTDG